MHRLIYIVDTTDYL